MQKYPPENPQILYFIHLDLPSSGIPSQSLSPSQSTPNSFEASPATSPCNSLQYMDTKGFFTTLLDPCGSKLQISLGTFVQIGTDFNFGTNLVLVLQRLYGCNSQLCNQRDYNKYRVAFWRFLMLYHFKYFFEKYKSFTSSGISCNTSDFLLWHSSSLDSSILQLFGIQMRRGIFSHFVSPTNLPLPSTSLFFLRSTSFSLPSASLFLRRSICLGNRGSPCSSIQNYVQGVRNIFIQIRECFICKHMLYSIFCC